MTGAIPCGGCQHVKAMHRATGPCRLNGCPCLGFSELAAFPIVLAPVPMPAEPSRTLAIAGRIAAAAIAFVAGVLVGQAL